VVAAGSVPAPPSSSGTLGPGPALGAQDRLGIGLQQHLDGARSSPARVVREGASWERRSLMRTTAARPARCRKAWTEDLLGACCSPKVTARTSETPSVGTWWWVRTSCSWSSLRRVTSTRASSNFWVSRSWALVAASSARTSSRARWERRRSAKPTEGPGGSGVRTAVVLMSDLRSQLAPSLTTLAGDDFFLPRCPVKVLLEPDSRRNSLPSAPVQISRIYISFPSCNFIKFSRIPLSFPFCVVEIRLSSTKKTQLERKNERRQELEFTDPRKKGKEWN
jgi:hypothetical protein